jgi:hypothetical protein
MFKSPEYGMIICFVALVITPNVGSVPTQTVAFPGIDHAAKLDSNGQQEAAATHLLAVATEHQANEIRMLRWVLSMIGPALVGAIYANAVVRRPS